MKFWFYPAAVILILLTAFCPSLPAQTGTGQAATAGNEGPGAVTRVFVSPQARTRVYEKVVIMPFRAATELAGASITDLFTAELLALGKYRLVEQTQMEQALSGQATGPRELFDTVAAIKLGKTLGVPGVIVGTVPEYEVRSAKKSPLAAIGITVRLIDVSDGSIVWSLTDSAVTDRPISLSAFAHQTIRKMVGLLFQEMLRVGDTTGVGVPVPRVAGAQGRIRGAVIEIQPDPAGTVLNYKILRGQKEEGPFQEVGLLPPAASQSTRFEESNLPDGETVYYRVAAVAPSRMTSLPTPPVKVTTAGPPGAVTGLAAQSGLIRRVVLTWQPSPDPQVRGYAVFRQAGRGPWEKIKILEGRNQATCTDPELGDLATYSYKIVTINQAGAESLPSTAVTAITKGPPAKVQKLEAVSLQPRKVPLKWTPVNEPEVKGYAVFRSSREEGPFEKIAFVAGKETGELVDGVKRGFFGIAAPLQDETRYYYKVQAVNIVDVAGPDSPVDNAVTKPVPEPVLGVQAGQLEVKQVSLKWKASEEADIAKYQIFRGRDPQSIQSLVLEVQAPATQGVDRKLEDGTKYYFQVRAVDKDGLEGKSSAVVSASTKPVPAKPRGLQAQWDGKRIRLTWAPNPEKDIQKYTIAQKSFLLFWEKVGESSGTEYIYQGDMKKGKTLSFRLTAIDQDLLEGEPSEEAEITVP